MYKSQMFIEQSYSACIMALPMLTPLHSILFSKIASSITPAIMENAEDLFVKISAMPHSWEESMFHYNLMPPILNTLCSNE